MVETTQNIAVVGGGIIGLTTAVCLLEAGHRVRVVARELPPDTTSNKAGAIWEPYAIEPKDRVARWSHVGYGRYAREAEDPDTGVTLVEMIEVSRVEELPKPFWWVPEYPFRRLDAAELPEGYRSGHGIRVPFIDSRRYLAVLMRRIASLGGDFELRHLDSLDAVGPAAAVVNCSGLGARELADDPEVYPIRGQLAIVSLPDGSTPDSSTPDCSTPDSSMTDPPVRHIFDDTSHPTDEPLYIFPRGDECILGGTAERDDPSTDEDRATRERILERCRTVEPSLRHSLFLRSVVGLRPGRAAVRLGRDPHAQNPAIFHNYGHGGAGFTVAWGCAEEVASLLDHEFRSAAHRAPGPKTRSQIGI